MKKRKKRITDEQVSKMRKNISNKKRNNHGGTFQEHDFCMAYLKIIEDPRGDLFKKCKYIYKPKDSCTNCNCNKKKQRWDYS